MFERVDAGGELVVIGLEFLMVLEQVFVFRSPVLAAGGEVTDVDLEGFILSASLLAFVFPVVATFEKFGEEDANGRTEFVGDVGERAKSVHSRWS